MLLGKLLQEGISFAAAALRENRLRTILSLSGITIGIFTIIAVYTAIGSLQKTVQSSIQQLGDQVVYVQKWPWTFGPDYPWRKYAAWPSPDIKELKKIQNNCYSFDAASFIVSTRVNAVKYNKQYVENVTIMGVTNDYDKTQQLKLSEGRYFSLGESHQGNAVAIIGYDISEAFFGFESGIGRKIKLKGRELTVIGVITKTGDNMFGFNPDASIILPYQYAKKFIVVKNANPMISVKAKEGISLDQLSDELMGAMRAIRKLKPKEESNFAINQTSILSNGVNMIFAQLENGGGIIGLFSLLIGGFGIANIMFVSVKERTREIGIQKSLGAKNAFILIQFLFESVLLCLIGGTFGMILVASGTWVSNNFFDIGLEMILSSEDITLGFVISFVIGVVSGFIPAFIAANLDPVEAMRSN